jgi:hypothetical protein
MCSGSPAPALSGRTIGRVARAANSAKLRPRGGCAAGVRADGLPRIGHGYRSQWHRARRSVAAPHVPVVTSWRGKRHRISAARAPSKRPTVAVDWSLPLPGRTRHSRPPGANPGSPSGEWPDARPCDPRCRRKPRRDGRVQPRTDCPWHSTITARSWCAPGPDRAPARWYRRQRPSATTAPYSRSAHAAARATSRYGPPSCTMWNGPASPPGGRRSAPDDTTANDQHIC